MVVVGILLLVILVVGVLLDILVHVVRQVILEVGVRLDIRVHLVILGLKVLLVILVHVVRLDIRVHLGLLVVRVILVILDLNLRFKAQSDILVVGDRLDTLVHLVILGLKVYKV